MRACHSRLHAFGLMAQAHCESVIDSKIKQRRSEARPRPISLDLARSRPIARRLPPPPHSRPRTISSEQAEGFWASSDDSMSREEANEAFLFQHGLVGRCVGNAGLEGPAGRPACRANESSGPPRGAPPCARSIPVEGGRRTMVGNV